MCVATILIHNALFLLGHFVLPIRYAKNPSLILGAGRLHLSVITPFNNRDVAMQDVFADVTRRVAKSGKLPLRKLTA